jgi:hypothetical protein
MTGDLWDFNVIIVSVIILITSKHYERKSTVEFTLEHSMIT